MPGAQRILVLGLILSLVAPRAVLAQEPEPIITKKTITWFVIGIGAAIAGIISTNRDARRAQAAMRCDGQPNWCFTFRSQERRETELFIDGKSIGRLSAGKERRVAVPASGRVFVNYCWEESAGLFDASTRFCSDPDTFEMDQNWTYLVYPVKKQ